ncbi:cupin domain-containing protein [Desulfovibrio sp. OttesenSCG-928-C06]|nr:cupin domain-containing protein [Desulfovibrio sp. OttesenSCG-928-C06]
MSTEINDTQTSEACASPGDTAPASGPESAPLQDVGSTEAYTTKDLSQIRELIHPAAEEYRAFGLGMSLAEAVVEESCTTASHRHDEFDEIYYCLEGAGLLYLDGEEHEFFPQSYYLIPRGTVHSLKAVTRIRLLCICSPGYTHEGTEII